jgi:hypothetical protein
MTPKEKAEELVRIFYYNIPNDEMGRDEDAAKECALIAIEQIIDANPIAFDEDDNCITKQWWQEVKIEIEKL